VSTSTIVKLPFIHLKRLSTTLGLYEHAQLDEPRTEHGYCVDDVSRALILLCYETELDDDTDEMLSVFLDFTLRAIMENGMCHNRMNVQGMWTDEASTEDCWGRAIWALGICAVHAPDKARRDRALNGFRTLAQASTPDLMALVFAALGAGEVFIAYPHESAAKNILMTARTRLIPANLDGKWFWPEPRLRYGNGSIAQAVLLAGAALNDRATVNVGIRMLDFLIKIETNGSHFSVTPVGGRGPGDPSPAFDQQPIELAAIASACALAWSITDNVRWLSEVDRAWHWFLGKNDVGARMFILHTGAGYDGLHLRGPNLNQGAESTIALLSTAQIAHRLAAAG